MFNLHITLAMALTGIKSIVERFGHDHIGSLPEGGCAYVEKVDGIRLVASCIVGQFFADLGILRVLVGDGYSGSTIPGLCGIRNEIAMTDDLRERLAVKWGITFADEAWTFLSTAQVEQDGAAQWGQAAEEAAKKILSLRGEPCTAMGVLALQAEDGDTGKPTVKSPESPLAEWERALLNGPTTPVQWVRDNYPVRPESIALSVKALRNAYPGMSLADAVNTVRAVYPPENY